MTMLIIFYACRLFSAAGLIFGVYCWLLKLRYIMLMSPHFLPPSLSLCAKFCRRLTFGVMSEWMNIPYF